MFIRFVIVRQHNNHDNHTTLSPWLTTDVVHCPVAQILKALFNFYFQFLSYVLQVLGVAIFPKKQQKHDEAVKR